jgi:hypothetical protein
MSLYEIDKNKPSRYRIYNPHLKESPILIDDFKNLYYEPYYQLMRQALLGWKMINAREYNCTECIHLHIIPTNNYELRSTNNFPWNGWKISS